jgi:oligopeptidase B
MGQSERKRKRFDYMIKYSPYENVKRAEIPEYADRNFAERQQVPYWEGAKFAAKIREMKTDDNVSFCSKPIWAPDTAARRADTTV